MSELLTARVNSDIVPIAVASPELALPPDLEQTVLSCLSSNKSKRIQTIEEMEHKLVAIRKVTPNTKTHAIDENEWTKKRRRIETADSEQKDGWLSKLMRLVGLK